MKRNNVVEQIDYAYIVEVQDILPFIVHTNRDVRYITLTMIIEMSLVLLIIEMSTTLLKTMPTSVSSNPTLSNKFEVLRQLEEESNE